MPYDKESLAPTPAPLPILGSESCGPTPNESDATFRCTKNVRRMTCITKHMDSSSDRRRSLARSPIPPLAANQLQVA